LFAGGQNFTVASPDPGTAKTPKGAPGALAAQVPISAESVQRKLAQSPATQQFLVSAQGAQVPPPQSTSVSAPSLIPLSQLAVAQSPETLMTLEPAVAAPAVPVLAQVLPRTRYQNSPPGAGVSVSNGPVVVAVKVARAHESTLEFNNAGKVASVPRRIV
jgi:hypothetical protein